MFVHNLNAAIFMAMKNVRHARVVQMLFAFLTAGSGELGDLFGMQMEKISGNGAVAPHKLNIDSTHVDGHSCGAGQVLALSSQNHQPGRLRPRGAGAKDHRTIGVKALPLMCLFLGKKLPKSAHGVINLSRAETRG